jgi:hypothetical protein
VELISDNFCSRTSSKPWVAVIQRPFGAGRRLRFGEDSELSGI